MKSEEGKMKNEERRGGNIALFSFLIFHFSFVNFLGVWYNEG